ncbi:MAG TPA: transposase, partial [Thermoanaerobaculia bacterium]
MRTSAGFPRRPSIRLRSFDYSSRAAYFITICSLERKCLFSRIVDGYVLLSPIGKIIERELVASPAKRPGLVIDEYQVMPNHLHFTCFLPASPSPGEMPRQRKRAPRSLGSFIGGYKAAVTSAVRELVGDPDFEVWQARYFDHVVRDQDDMDRIREYIRENPLRWEEDELF